MISDNQYGNNSRKINSDQPKEGQGRPFDLTKVQSLSGGDSCTYKITHEAIPKKLFAKTSRLPRLRHLTLLISIPIPQTPTRLRLIPRTPFRALALIHLLDLLKVEIVTAQTPISILQPRPFGLAVGETALDGHVMVRL